MISYSTSLAENLQLFDRGRTIKLGGFEKAMSTEANTGVKLKDHRHLSTFLRATPEVIEEEMPSTAADIWSVMCTMVHMITGMWPGCVEAPRLAVSMLILVSCYYKFKRIVVLVLVLLNSITGRKH